MIISGANNLYNNKQTVDDLNVFPVPDGDTGTNMSLTAMAMVDSLKDCDMSTISKVADNMAYATLRGARGNSGVILSQFFRGISKSIKGKETITAKELANALSDGSHSAYKAVMKPTEGTILTVSRLAAEGAMEGAENGDFTELMRCAVTKGNEALQKTTQMLPALREAGVVDAGGQGWMCILEGALAFLKTDKVIKAEGVANAPKKETAVQTAVSTNIRFKYCTEFILEKTKRAANVEKFKQTIKPKGNCMLVIDDDDVVKVHIHTNHPGFVLEEAIKLGEITNLKIDNMKRQHNSIVNSKSESEPAKVLAKPEKAVKAQPVEKKIKTEEKIEFKDYGFVAVCAGKGIAEVLADLGVDRIVEGGQSMNPSTHDIVKAITKVNAKTVFVFPSNKNIIMAANQAIDLIGNKKVVVIPTTTIPQTIRAIMDFNANRDAEFNEKAMNKAISKVKSGQITYAVRNTELEGETIRKGDILGLLEGKVKYVSKDMDKVLFDMLDEMTDEDTEYITVYYGKDVKQKAVGELQAKCISKYEADEIEVSFKKGAQPLYYYIISVE